MRRIHEAVQVLHAGHQLIVVHALVSVIVADEKELVENGRRFFVRLDPRDRAHALHKARFPERAVRVGPRTELLVQHFGLHRAQPEQRGIHRRVRLDLARGAQRVGVTFVVRKRSDVNVGTANEAAADRVLDLSPPLHHDRELLRRLCDHAHFVRRIRRAERLAQPFLLEAELGALAEDSRVVFVPARHCNHARLHFVSHRAARPKVLPVLLLLLLLPLVRRRHLIELVPLRLEEAPARVAVRKGGGSGGGGKSEGGWRQRGMRRRRRRSDCSRRGSAARRAPRRGSHQRANAAPRRG